MSTFKTKQTHNVSKYVIKWPPATIIDELHLFANKYVPYHCHVSNQVNAWVNKPAQLEALAAISAGCRWRPSTANVEVRLPRDLKWQRSSSLAILPCFQRATASTKLDLETRLYRSQLSLIQMLARIPLRPVFVAAPHFPSAPYSWPPQQCGPWRAGAGCEHQAGLRASWGTPKPGPWVLCAGVDGVRERIN